MIFQSADNIKIKVFLSSVFLFIAYVIFVIRPVFVMRGGMDAAFDSLLERLTIAKKSFISTHGDSSVSAYADQAEDSKVLSLLQALAIEDRLEIDDIRVKNGGALSILIRGQERGFMRFLSRLKELPFLLHIVSIHIKTALKCDDELQANICLERVDFSHH